MSALWKDEFIKKYVYLSCYLDPSMSTDIAQVVDGTIAVISEDVKMRNVKMKMLKWYLIAYHLNLSYIPQKFFLTSRQRMESKNEVANVNG